MNVIPESLTDEQLDKFLEKNKQIKSGLMVYPQAAWVEKVVRNFRKLLSTQPSQE